MSVRTSRFMAASVDARRPLGPLMRIRKWVIFEPAAACALLVVGVCEAWAVRVAVVGGGVSGLTCAVRLLEQGARVTLISGEPPGSTTSAAAGAVWFPYRVKPNERTGPWGALGYRRFAELAATRRAP